MFVIHLQKLHAEPKPLNPANYGRRNTNGRVGLIKDEPKLETISYFDEEGASD